MTLNIGRDYHYVEVAGGGVWSVCAALGISTNLQVSKIVPCECDFDIFQKILLCDTR